MKFFFAGPFLEWADRRIPGDPYRILAGGVPADSQRILDACAGTGYAGRALADRMEVTAVDLSPELLRLGERRAHAAGASIRFVRADAQSLPFPVDSFDVVLCAFGLHELTARGRVAALIEVRRVLRPGGTLHVVDLDHPHRGRRTFLTYLRVSHNADTRKILGFGLTSEIESVGMHVTKHAAQLGGFPPFQHVIARA